MNNQPTYLGKVTSVSGSSINIELTQNVRSGLLIIEGKTHRIGQVGSFIRIPQGYNNLYGIISETNETSDIDSDSETKTDKRTLKVELVGESIGGEFERGLSQFPSISDEVHLVTERDLARIYGGQKHGQIVIGKLSSSDSIDISIDLDNLVNKHSAILGSTGSGKSTSVSSLLRAIVTEHTDTILKPSSRIVLFDIHGEYSSALKDISNTYTINPTSGERSFYIPFWCISPYSLCNFLCGNHETLSNKFIELVTEEKKNYVKQNPELKLDAEKITTFTPLPFRIKKVWYDLYHYDNANYEEKEKINPSYQDKGSFENLVPPTFLPPGSSSNKPFKGGAQVWRKQLEQMRTILLDSQYSFLIEPGDWNPSPENKITKDLDELINYLIGSEKPISIFDLSGMPSSRLELFLGSVIEVLFESSIWGRTLDEGMKSKPLLLVMEEAHRYLSSENNGLAKQIVRRIAKEGRKFGVGAMLVSQRPSEVDETILSQCGTLFSLRINNATDRARVKSALSDSLSGIIDSLPILRTGESIVTGEAVRMPMRFRFKIPREGQFPDSHDPKVSESWSNQYKTNDFIKLVNNWRKQEFSK